MNIFALSKNPEIAALYHADKHVVKMILEYAQLLSTAHRLLDGVQYTDVSSGRNIKRWRLCDDREQTLYKATHVNHPCAVWARETSDNYKWLYELFYHTCKEYTHRYGKVHLTESKLLYTLKDLPDSIPIAGMTLFPLAMPDNLREEVHSLYDCVNVYRKYYHYKRDVSGIQMHWSSPRTTPSWMCNKELIQEDL